MRIEGGLSLEDAQVTGAIQLCNIVFDLEAYPLPEPRHADAAPSPGLAELEAMRVAVTFRDCRCDSDFEVSGLGWRLPPVSEDDRIAADRIRLPCRTPSFYRDVSAKTFAIVDLRGLRCRSLSDDFGRSWGLIYRVRLRAAGLRLEAVEPSSRTHSSDASPGPWSSARTRTGWLTHAARRQPVSGRARTETTPPDYPTDPIGVARRYFCSREEDFVPQSYDEFAKAYIASGEHETGRYILVERKDIQNVLQFKWNLAWWKRHFWWVAAAPFGAASGASYGIRPNPIVQLVTSIVTAIWLAALLAAMADAAGIADAPHGTLVRWTAGILTIVIFWPFVVGLLMWLFREGFRYGLSPNRAMVTFALCIGVGTAAVHYARTVDRDGEGPVLTLTRRRFRCSPAAWPTCRGR